MLRTTTEYLLLWHNRRTLLCVYRRQYDLSVAATLNFFIKLTQFRNKTLKLQELKVNNSTSAVVFSINIPCYAGICSLSCDFVTN